jgi:FkbH-like protein
MKAVVRLAGKPDVSRLAQLCQRTNQFNLTTKRYTESDINALLEDENSRVYTLQVRDRFGPMGLSGLIIWKRFGTTAVVDTFLMSCRIIGRTLDCALFCGSLQALRELWGLSDLRASFVPTQKNSIVSGLWAAYGFSSSHEGGTDYACKVGGLRVTLPEAVELTARL